MRYNSNTYVHYFYHLTPYIGIVRYRYIKILHECNVNNVVLIMKKRSFRATTLTGKPRWFIYLLRFLELINETPLSARVHGVPVRGINKRFICGAIWLNNNYLTSLQGLSKSVEELLELPAYLTWIDISYNEFKNIGQVQRNCAWARFNCSIKFKASTNNNIMIRYCSYIIKKVILFLSSTSYWNIYVFKSFFFLHLFYPTRLHVFAVYIYIISSTIPKCPF